MPVVLHQFGPDNNHLTYAVAKELAKQTAVQFGAVRGSRVDIGPGSCCAAVAVNKEFWGAAKKFVRYESAPVFNFRTHGGRQQARGRIPVATFGAALPYGIVYGNSMIVRGGLDQGPMGVNGVRHNLGDHAERCALTAARGATLYDIGRMNRSETHVNKRARLEENAVLFVELSPCTDGHNCLAWLRGGGGGVENPFNGIINGTGTTTLHVWYRWTHPEETGQMLAFHRLSLQNQLSEINNSW